MDPKNPLIEMPDNLSEWSSDESGSSDKSSVSELSTESVSVDETSGSLHSASITTASSSKSDTSDETDFSSELENEHKFFAVLKEFPTMLMFIESNKDTMDSLLEPECPHMDTKADTPEWEARWTAWIFQVISALCQIQSLWAMTHNDLHSNNILWTPTDKPFLYYNTRDGRL